MKVPFLDLRIADKQDRQQLLAAVDRVLQHGRFILGPELSEFEQSMAAECGRTYAVGVGSGSSALYLGLRSLGIGPGDEVITTALSWIATANSIAMTGATPVFADLRDDLNLDPKSVARLVTPKTKAIMPVHYTGRVCDMDALGEIAERHQLLIIEDAAQAFRAKLRGRQAGSFGDIACFSTNPMKVFAACGESGFVVTDRKDVDERLRSLRYSGTVNKEVCHETGLNFRMDTLQAAILLERLGRVDRIIDRRRAIAARYRELLAGLVELPPEVDDEFHVYYTFTIQADRRDQLKNYLTDRDVETKVQHPYLMPDQPAYLETARGEVENARRLVQRILCIPSSEIMTDDQVDYVADCIRDFYERHGGQ